MLGIKAQVRYPSVVNSLMGIPETPPTSDQMSDDDPYNAHLARSFVPVATQSMTEQEAVQQSVQRRQSDYSSAAPTSTAMWPSRGAYCYRRDI